MAFKDNNERLAYAKQLFDNEAILQRKKASVLSISKGEEYEGQIYHTVTYNGEELNMGDNE
jgi:hypothetical protein